jgi:gliding motility-associated-like protein
MILCIAFVFIDSHAQKQASIWYFGDGNGLDFSKNPYEILENAPEESGRYITISDKDGNLLFYCDYHTVWNADNEIIENGTGLGGSPSADKIIVPRPGSETQFYIFQVKDDNATSINSEVLFSLVDMTANGGAGKVILKNELLYKNLHGSITSGGNCETGYWLVGETGTNIIPAIGTDLIYAFKIDEDSVHRTPVVSEPVSIGASGEYRLSPTGEYLYFVYSGNFVEGSAIAAFDLETGKVGNFKNAGPCCGVGEFSADGKYLYVAYWGLKSELMQYDLTRPDLEGELISDYLSIYQMQLAPDGKIYALYNDGNIPKMAVINMPGKVGLACDLITDVTFPFSSNPIPAYLPESATHLLYNATDRIDAGLDFEICSGDSVVIGGVNNPEKNYEWFPVEYLDDPSIKNPTFSYLNSSETIATFTYYIQSCETDMMKIKVFPRPRSKIYGSKSVCPRVEGVDYWVDEMDSLTYVWSVDGGQLTNGQYTDSIKVDWGKTNPDAGVELIVNNQFNCPSDPITFPVRINVELQTETPVGEDLLCANLGSGIPYSITNTNGSVYNWESDAGNINSGQGTNKVTVDWPGEGKYRLWVKEQSTTIDTVCYGISDSLLVDLFRDSTTIEVEYAQVMREDPGSLQVQWYVSDTARLAGEIEIYASSELSNQWDLVHVAGREQVDYVYPDTIMNISPVSFRIASTNGCHERIESDIHTTVLLEGIADSARNAMTLTWTPYVGWGDKMSTYELWYRKDGGQYARAATFLPNERRWSNSWGANGFEHDYRIRAVHADGRTESWSNEVRLSFHHTLTIPNVFTPNGDGVNDTFTFPKLEIFHENDLLVFDRYGKEVFSRKDYDGSWDGNGFAAGVYYYSFTEKRYGTTYKGWLQILR